METYSAKWSQILTSHGKVIRQRIREKEECSWTQSDDCINFSRLLVKSKLDTLTWRYVVWKAPTSTQPMLTLEHNKIKIRLGKWWSNPHPCFSALEDPTDVQATCVFIILLRRCKLLFYLDLEMGDVVDWSIIIFFQSWLVILADRVTTIWSRETLTRIELGLVYEFSKRSH